MKVWRIDNYPNEWSARADLSVIEVTAKHIDEALEKARIKFLKAAAGNNDIPWHPHRICLIAEVDDE
jgi:hypothetical protein